MSGPPPKDASQRRRRNVTPGFRLLPYEGRTAPAPDFPLVEPSDAESALWNKVWTLPQSVEWERMHCEDVVALYVRTFVAATDPSIPVVKRNRMLPEVRQLDAKIGLSPKAMRDLRWETEPPPEEPEELVVTTSKQTDNERSFVPTAP